MKRRAVHGIAAGITVMTLTLGCTSNAPGPVEVGPRATIVGKKISDITLPDAVTIPNTTTTARPALGTETLADITAGTSDGKIVHIEGPAVVIKVTHWCDRCIQTLQAIAAAQRDGSFRARVYIVSTGQIPDAPHWPATEYLLSQGVDGIMIVDDIDSAVEASLGTTDFPGVLAINAERVVVDRAAGEITKDRLVELAAATARTN